MTNKMPPHMRRLAMAEVNQSEHDFNPEGGAVLSVIEDVMIEKEINSVMHEKEEEPTTIKTKRVRL